MEEPRLREIQICVLNDANAPVQDEIIDSALALVSDEYRAHVGIVFRPQARIDVPFAPSGWPMDTAFFLAGFCPKDAELRFIFSDRDAYRAQASMTQARDNARMAGDSHPYFGFIRVYSVQERWNARNAAGERALMGTLRHEIGHLFGLDDEKEDPASFMYFSSNLSLGRWTLKAIVQIQGEKWRRWWPRA